MCAALVGGLVSPVWAASADDDGDARGGVELGSFASGDGLEGAIGELDGSLGFGLSAGGVSLEWDSRGVGADAVGLGAGWSFGLATVRVTGGVWVYPASGGAYEMNLSAPSGLAGYPGTDVRFEAAVPGAVVPGRADGSVRETAYAYALHELGGVSTYFDAAGHPVARVVLGGERLDWTWAGGGAGRLTSVVSPDGSVTALDWSDPGRVMIVPGSMVTDPVEGAGAGGRWLVELDGGRVSALIDPVGGRTQVTYDRQGMVERVTDPAGAMTVVQWQASSDGVPRVERVRVLDAATGAELSAREWSVQGDVSPSGWPLSAEPHVPGVALGPGFETSVSDGKTRVRSGVDAHGRLTERAVVAGSSSGEWVVQEQEMEYPEVGGPMGRPGEGMQPTSASTTHHDLRGGTRVATESYERDEFGRMVSRVAIDGSIVRWVYDDVVPRGRALPVGLVVEETTTAADGLVRSTRSALSEDRGAVVATEQWSEHAGGELVRVGRVEADVADGFVTEERVFPAGDPAATPAITRWTKQVDVARGTRSVVETVAAGTSIEAATVSVSSLVHGGVLSETDEVGAVTSAMYDQAGRPTAVEDTAGRTVAYAYRSRQADGINAVMTTDTIGVTETEERDVLGRVVEKTLRSDTETAPGQRRELDALGRVVSQTDQRGVAERTSYTPDGLVAEIVSDTGRVLTNEYDPVTRDLVTTRVRSADGAEVVSSFENDRAGRVVAVYDPADEAGTRISYEHDDFGNVTRTVYPDGAEIRHEYDQNGRKRATIDIDGNRTEYTYDAKDGAMVAAVQVDRDGQHVSGVRYGYDEYRRMNVLERDNGVRTEVTFTSTAEVASEITTGPDGVRSERAYEYTPVGDLTSRIDRVRDETGQLEVTRTDYEYDGFDRLMGALAKRGIGKFSKTCMELMDLACIPSYTAVGQDALGNLRGRVSGDDLLARQKAVYGWRVSLEKAEPERLPQLVGDFMDPYLTVNMDTAMVSLQKARRTATDALDSNLQAVNALEAHDLLVAAESRIKTLVETADEQLALAESHIASFIKSDFPGTGGLTSVQTQITQLRNDLGVLLDRKPPVIVDRY
ncbi:hypothetical protein [Agromyces silvae]|uniref:hypothetical protein n=1 Tax=Agromyces silvae TaxID=3388266 RepID=UPI00280C18FD|nr:hypothetical protein [Agromyces protaetiae]